MEREIRKYALQNAVSAASMLVITEAVVADMPEKKKKGGASPAMGGMEEMGEEY